MTTPPTVPSVPALDAEGRIASDLACVRCGYNLRGLAPAGPCPECGTGIERSLHGNWLAYADPDWVARLTRGAVWTIRGINCILLTYILGIVALIVTASVAGRGWRPPGSFIGISLAGGGLALLGLVSLVLGYWWLTQPDPARPDEDENQGLRMMGRIGLLGVPLSLLVTTPLARLLPNPVVAVVAGGLLTVALVVIGCIGFFGYLASLARRLPDDVLARRSRAIGRGLVVCILLYATTLGVNLLMVRGMAVPGAATPGARPAGPPAAMAMSPCFLVVLGLAILFYLNLALRLLMKLRKQLRQIREQARRNWNASIVPPVPPVPPDVLS